MKSLNKPMANLNKMECSHLIKSDSINVVPFIKKDTINTYTEIEFKCPLCNDVMNLQEWGNHSKDEAIFYIKKEYAFLEKWQN